MAVMRGCMPGRRLHAEAAAACAASGDVARRSWYAVMAMEAPGPDFRWDDLKLFLAAYRTRSLTRAAARLGLNQSTLSRRLRGFEQALGSRLFDRTPEGLVPTETADRLLDAAERAEEASHDAARLCASLGEAVRGEVRLALSEGMADYIAAPALPRLRERHPELRLHLVVSAESADLSRREADMAIRFYRPSRGDLIAKRLWRGGYALFAAPSLAAKLGEGPVKLAGLPFVGWDVTQGHYPERRFEERAGVEPVVRASSFITRVALARAGLGAIQLTREWGNTLAGLVELPSEPLDLQAEVWLVTHRALRHVPRITAVWQWIEDELLNLNRA